MMGEQIKTPDQINSTRLLMVEGKDEVGFFGAMLAHLGITGVQIFNVGGNTHFPKKVPGLMSMHGFSSVTVCGVIRDAEGSAEGTFQSVKNLFERMGRTIPNMPKLFSDGTPRIGVYIMPGNAASGMLEDLCLETVAGSPISACVEGFIACIGNTVKWREPGTGNELPHVFPNNPSKARARAYLAGQVDDIPSVGIAAGCGVWNFGHESLADLRTFLENFRR